LARLVTRSQGTRYRRKFANVALPSEENAGLSLSAAAGIAQGKNGTVLIDNGNHKTWPADQLMRLLQEHVQNNVVKIGKKHYRQKQGIPQGSVLSSMLCSIFYSDFERQRLDFLDPQSSLLVRLIDDFLLITTNKAHAAQFFKVMANGDAEYGLSIQPEKTLANFEAHCGLQKVPRLQNGVAFPYCGITIDTTTLEVKKDWRRKDAFVSNGLTVDSGPKPGAAFRRKVIASLKLQLNTLLIDPILNRPDRIISTYHEAFEDTAMRMHQYSTHMSQRARPSAASFSQLFMTLVQTALGLGQRKASSMPQPTGPISKQKMVWIACTAFEDVLGPKQSGYFEFLTWLRDIRRANEPVRQTRVHDLRKAIESNDRVLRGCRY
jgi:telomerase reverse transcriptase